jgi:Uncharacterized conserved protein related to C-terminal domain of eukaryotic chaperone, SACSIN
MTCNSEEWYKQANFDIAAAINMSESTTYPYAVFFCQQAIEKALKGLYIKKFRKQPDKIHSLVAIAVKLDMLIPNSISATIQLLNAASISIRYPPDLEELFKIYSQERVQDIINRTEEVLDWILRQ